MIIAYEPVWAIGATEAMNARDVHQMTIFIKKTLTELYKMKTRISITDSLWWFGRPEMLMLF
jgi:triosephosphate isomerase